MNYITLILGLFLIFTPLNSVATGDRAELMQVLSEYLDYNMKFLEALKGTSPAAYLDLRDDREWFVEEKFNPNIDLVVKQICGSQDKEMLNLYLDIIATLKHNVNNTPFIKLGEIFICNPNLVHEQIIAFENNSVLRKALIKGYEQARLKKHLPKNPVQQDLIESLR